MKKTNLLTYVITFNQDVALGSNIYGGMLCTKYTNKSFTVDFMYSRHQSNTRYVNIFIKI